MFNCIRVAGDAKKIEAPSDNEIHSPAQKRVKIEVIGNREMKAKLQRMRKGAAVTQSPYTNPDRRKKAKMEAEKAKLEMDMIVEPLPVPFKGKDDYMFDIVRDNMLGEWIAKHNKVGKSTKIGLATGCYGNGMYEYITAHNLSEIRGKGWLGNSVSSTCFICFHFCLFLFICVNICSFVFISV